MNVSSNVDMIIKVLSDHQKVTRPHNSCFNQFLSIVHDIRDSFHVIPSLKTCNFTSDLAKYFERKFKSEHDSLWFKNSSVYWTPAKKHLVLLLGETLNFQHHIYVKNKHVCQGERVTIKRYKSFIRLHSNWGDAIMSN